MGINTNPTIPGTRSYGRARAVKAALTPKRRTRPVVVNHDYAAFPAVSSALRPGASPLATSKNSANSSA